MPDLLRETFEAYALQAPDADGLREAVDARVRRDRTRRRRLVAATAAAATLAAGVVVVAVRPGRRDSAPVVTQPPPSPTLSPTGPERTPLVPPPPRGMRWATARGLAVAVPEAWFDSEFYSCGIAATDAVVIWRVPGAGQCGTGLHEPNATVVTITSPVNIYPLARPRERDVVVDGVGARRITGIVNDGDGRLSHYAEVLAIDGRKVAVYVVSPDPAVAARIVDTARVASETDVHGCPVRLASATPAGPPRRPEARHELVPGAPVQASVCRYFPDGSLERSVVVERAALASLAGTFNGLRRDPRPLPDAGSDEGAAPSASFDPDAGPNSPFVLTFRYAGGPDVVVHVDRSGAIASNGAVEATGPGALKEALEPLVAWYRF